MLPIPASYREPETVFVPQMVVPENRQSWQCVGCLFFRLRARLRSRSWDFHYSIEKRCGKLGRYGSSNEIHVLYNAIMMSFRYIYLPAI